MPEKLSTYKDDVSEAEAVSQITESVYDLIGNPISKWAVAATIESLGVRDIDAKTDYGFDSVFDLADDVYTRIKNKIYELNEDDEDESDEFNFGGFRRTLKLFAKHYSAGMIFSLPMISQIVAILIFEYALWAWFDFNEAQATVVALGTIVAFMITGGFIQTLGRLVSKYKGEGNYYLASKATWSVMKVAIPFVLLFALALFGLNLILPFYPQQLMILTLVYMILIAMLLLAAAVLFATEQRTVILLGIVLGTIVVIFLMDFSGFGIYTAQWIGIGISTIIMGGYGYLYYRLKIRNLRQELFKQSLPQPEVSYYNIYRYFIYGFCYFTFLFMDRLLAWSAGPPPPQYIIWFNTPYELGMDWALISLVITIAMLEFSIHSFSFNLIPAQKKAVISKIKLFNKYFRRFYVKQVLLLLFIGVISILITYYGVLSLRIYENEVPEIADSFANPMTFKVFWLASIGYLFLIYGLLNSLFFFTLNRPELVMYSMIGALFVNFVTGYLCSRIFGLEYAVIGLIAGSLVFSIVTGVLARRFFKHLDYYYYSAF
jgi:Na+-driven multidrug efflux pump